MAKLNFKKLINELNENEIIIKNDLNEIVKINKNDLKFIEFSYLNDYEILKNNKILNKFYEKYIGAIVIYNDDFEFYNLNENEINIIYNELLNILINNKNNLYVINKNDNNISLSLNYDYYNNYII